MKIQVVPTALGMNYTVWVNNYRLKFEGTKAEAEAIALEFRRGVNRSGKKKYLTATA